MRRSASLRCCVWLWSVLAAASSIPRLHAVVGGAGEQRIGVADHSTVFADGFPQLAKRDIIQRQRGLSGIPEGFGQTLTRLDFRDLVEFLANLK